MAEHPALNSIFLSASVPDPRRNPRYFQTADVVAIREAVRALVTVALPRCTLVWGGHPAITPMIRFVTAGMQNEAPSQVVLYQSEYFAGQFPASNAAFEHLVHTPALSTREASLALMRKQMLTEHTFQAGIFIGGMEGVEEEFTLFQQYQPTVPVLPIASTGGAAKLLYKQEPGRFSPDLNEEYSYLSLFRRHLPFLT